MKNCATLIGDGRSVHQRPWDAEKEKDGVRTR